MHVGDVTFFERTFTVEEVKQFGQISGDLGIHHVQSDAQGRVLVQGLLTATLPTKLGGDLNFLARKMTLEFLRPVFTGDTIRCESTTEYIEKQADRTAMVFAIVCRNQLGKEVLTGHIHGIIRDESAKEK